MRQLAVVLVLALLVCACRSRPRARSAATTGQQQYVVLRMRQTPDLRDDGAYFIESHVVSSSQSAASLQRQLRRVPADEDVEASQEALQAALRRSGARVLQAPLMLVLEGQEGTVFIGENDRAGKIVDGFSMALTASQGPESPTVQVSYQTWRKGALIHYLDPTHVSAPLDEVIVLRSQRSL